MNAAALRFNIIPVLIGMIGLITALVLGIFIGGGEIRNLAVISGIVIVILILATMRQYIWFLIPMLWGFTGSVYVLPLPFSVRDLAVMLVAAVAFALLALRIYRFQNRWTFIDFLLLLNLGQVALAFIAHPTGLRALSSETVGARPYFNIAIAFIAYFILANQTLPVRFARKLPIFILIPEAISSVIMLLVRVKPSLGYPLGMVYSGFFPTRQIASSAGPVIDRLAIGTGRTLITILVSYFRPLSLLVPINFVRFFLFLLGLGLILISGFRSEFITVGAIFLLASYFRRGRMEAVVVLGGMIVMLITLTLINSIRPLPLAMQRTLSFLPGHWDSRAVKDAEDSTDWRVQMWREIPKSSRYIRDRVMGDGFGFTRAELMAMERQALRTGELSQEDSMIIGAFHNGPLSTIRFVGAVGLILYYSLLVYVAMYAARLIRSCAPTSFYPLALFVSLPLIWEPFNYVFIFGAYDSGFPNTIFAIGMLKMIQNSLRADTSQKSRRSIDVSPSEIREVATAVHR
ncbi:MAG TPA: hypothetical protein VGM62_19510 [Chthoniobacterales bacterium]